MRVEQIEIEGFRGISSVRIAMPRRLTVLVGGNGVGKTSILDALAILLDNYVARWLKGTAQSAERVRDSDMKIGAAGTRLWVNVSDQLDNVSWTLRRQGRYERITSPAGSELDGLNSFVRKKVEASQGKFETETLFIYYGQRRAVLDVPQRIRVSSDQKPEAAFADALKVGDLNFREFVSWFRDRSLVEAQQWIRDPSYKDKQLEAVRVAMTSATGLRNPVYRAEVPSGLIVQKEGVDLRVDQLSSGEKSFLALSGDLARRLAMLSGDSSRPLEGAGIVLIDEVELHLHPIWQRRILPFLVNTFPNCQFIVTTHSPQVLGLVHADDIVVVEKNGSDVSIAVPLASYGRDSNFILLSILGATERDDSLKSSLDALDIAITQREFVKAEHVLAELNLAVEGHPPELALAQARLERAKRKI